MISIAAPQIGQEEQDAVARVLSSGQLAQGKTVEEFERLFCEYSGSKFAVAVSSGTAALELALRAHGVTTGDEVITTPFSFAATVNTILSVGATPVFVDIDPDSFCVDARLIPDAITSRTKAILPVHLFGRLAEIEAIADIANENKLAVIEDAAQAHGAEVDGRKVGTFGTGCFSFYPTKNITTGEGGIVTTDDPEIAESIKLLRNHGMGARYQYESLGYNLRMTEIHAAIGVAQMPKLEAFIEKRRQNAAVLTAGLDSSLTPPIQLGKERHVFNQYTIRIPGGRGSFAETLRENGVGSGIYYPSPLNLLPHVADNGSYPHTEQACREVISLPVHPGLSDADLTKIVETTNSLIRNS